MSSRARLLVVDDDQRLRDLLDQYLSNNGFHITTAQNGEKALSLLENSSFEAAILDVMMPGMTGFDLLIKIRTQPKTENLPILMLTAVGETTDRIKGFENGADDYLPKPFDPKELLLRIQSILKRHQPIESPDKAIRLGDHKFDMDRELLYEGEKVISLTTVEGNLLRILANNAGRTVSRDDLAELSGVALSPRTIDVQVTRLRRKIEEDPKNPIYLKTVRHKGYVLWPD